MARDSLDLGVLAPSQEKWAPSAARFPKRSTRFVRQIIKTGEPSSRALLHKQEA